VLVGVVEANVKLFGAAPAFSAGAVGVAEGAPNENRLFAGVEGGAGAVVTDSLVDWPKEKGAGGLEFSVIGAVAGKDADVKAGLEIGRAGFRVCSASAAGAGVVALGKEKAWVVTSADWVSGFGLGTGAAGDEGPNPRNEFIAPPKSGFRGAGLASFFSVG
jgi:hypothetical protein